MTPPLVQAVATVAAQPIEQADQAIEAAQSLDGLAPGQRACVAAVQGQRGLRRRLLEMGLSTGVEVAAVRRAPLGDPIQFMVRGYHLCLRRDDARHVLIRPTSHGPGPRRPTPTRAKER